MAIAQLDFPQLSSYLALPHATITTILDAPTAELVQTLLAKISAKAREHDETTSENLRLEVELENAVRSGETKSRVLKSSVDKGLKEITDLRQKLQAEGKSGFETDWDISTHILRHRKLKSCCRLRTTNAQIIDVVYNLGSHFFELAHRIVGDFQPRHSVLA